MGSPPADGCLVQFLQREKQNQTTDTMNRMMIYLGLPMLSAMASMVAVYLKPTPALQARRWLILSMLCGGLSALLLAHYYHPTLRFSLTLDWLCDVVLLCLAPCFYLCLLSLTSPDGIRKRDYLVFAPGGVLMLITTTLCLIMGTDEAQSALEEIVLRTRPVASEHSWAFRAYAFFGHTFYRSFVIVSLIEVFYRGAWAVRNYRQQLENYLVDIPPSLTRGIRLLYVSFVLFALVGMVFAACEYAQTLTAWVVPMLSIGTAISFGMMGYFAWQVRNEAIDLEALGAEAMAEKAIEEALTGEEDPFREKLAKIEQEKMYRDANLTIFSLSRRIGTNRTYLTKAFRTCYGESFSEHINRLRTEDAIRMMREHPKMPLHEVASHVGYNSATSLYRNFMRIHHCSPTEYMRQCSNLEN